MTGFGRGEYRDNEHGFTVEIKSVNHRYHDTVLRFPKSLNGLEDKIRQTIAGKLVRGHIEAMISRVDYAEPKRTVRVNPALAITYSQAIQEVAESIGAPFEKNPYRIASFPEVLVMEEEKEDIEALWVKLEVAVKNALENLLSMRVVEGEALANDLHMRVARLEEYIAQIEAYTPSVFGAYRDGLMARMRDVLADLGAEPDEARILQEAAIYAEKVNITEELVRLKSHIRQFDKTLHSSESVGRKLDFIVQEINRETNTIASKVNNFGIASIVIEIKSEIEKIREQIQNVE
jgi:uncharacterized protein (TIGR00255 family)